MYLHMTLLLLGHAERGMQLVSRLVWGPCAPEVRCKRCSVACQKNAPLRQTLISCLWLPDTFTCAFKPGSPMSHIWLPTPDCKFY